MFQYFYTIFSFILLLLSWDIELNPGPREGDNILSICHWNLNSVWVDEFSKIAHISAFLNAHNFDIFCLSETFLDSSITDDDPRISIKGYSIHRCDHPSNSRRGGVCIYFKDGLSLLKRSDLTSLEESLVCEVKTGSKKLFICHLYRSPSQNSDKFTLFKQKWEQTLININACSPTISLFLGDFNARNSEWWTGDITNTQGKDIGDLSAQYGLHQLIDEPTHILPESSSCIDLIFSSSEALIMDSGVLPSLYPRCHHQVPFVKVNFKIKFPPAYQRKIWDFSRADPRVIKRAVDGLDWEGAFVGLSVDQRVSFLSDCILNIFSNLVPSRIVTIRDKDASWMTPEIKRMILEKAKAYRLC